MKIPKDAARTARALIRATTKSGQVDGAFAKAVVNKLATEKPRNYLATLTAYQRLLRLEFAARHAVIDSAEPLSAAEQQNVIKELKGKYGEDVTSEFRVDPSLIGGMKVKLGSNVWDATVLSRLHALKDAFNV
jgi:F-type H+-transporting ATPase subunit delta